MRQVRFEITDGICRPAGCETDDIGYAAISDAQCASEARKSSTASSGRISYGIVMTVTENGFNETTSFPDISFSRKKLSLRFNGSSQHYFFITVFSNTGQRRHIPLR